MRAQIWTLVGVLLMGAAGGEAGAEAKRPPAGQRPKAPPKQEPVPAAYVFAIDTSGSMGGAKLEAVQTAIVEALGRLGKADRIGVIGYDREAREVTPLQVAAANQRRIVEDLDKLKAAGGTDVVPVLRAARAALREAKEPRKQVILVLDGDSPRDGLDDVLAELRAAKIAITCIGLAGADRELLSGIAQALQGRLYMEDAPGDLPRRFVSETKPMAPGP